MARWRTADTLSTSAAAAEPGRGGGAPAAAAEEDDGYTHSGKTGRNGWVKPTVSEFVDEGPPPEPKRSELR